MVCRGCLGRHVLKVIPGPVAVRILQSHFIKNVFIVHDGKTVAVIGNPVILILVPGRVDRCLKIILQLSPGLHLACDIHGCSHGCK